MERERQMDILRDVRIEDFRLTVWDTYKTDRDGKSRLGYRLSTINDNKIIFERTDFYCSPMHCVDSDQTMRSILTFLTLRRGDVESDYFTNYTPEQIAFRDNHAEYISLWSMDDGPEFEEFEEKG